MTSKYVKFKKGKDPLKLLDARGNAIYRGVWEAVEEATTAVEAQAKANVTGLGKVDRGILRASIESRVEADQRGNIRGIVVAGAAHARWVEFGRRGIKSDPTGGNPLAAKAAWPPVKVIRDWVARKYREFAPAGRTASGRARKKTKKNARLYNKGLNSLAFLIGRKIYEHGIAPAPFLGPAFRQHRRTFKRRVELWVSARLKEIK